MYVMQVCETFHRNIKQQMQIIKIKYKCRDSYTTKLKFSVLVEFFALGLGI